jgi:hypothetical protein
MEQANSINARRSPQVWCCPPCCSLTTTTTQAWWYAKARQDVVTEAASPSRRFRSGVPRPIGRTSRETSSAGAAGERCRILPFLCLCTSLPWLLFTREKDQTRASLPRGNWQALLHARDENRLATTLDHHTHYPCAWPLPGLGTLATRPFCEIIPLVHHPIHISFSNTKGKRLSESRLGAESDRIVSGGPRDAIADFRLLGHGNQPLRDGEAFRKVAPFLWSDPRPDRWASGRTQRNLLFLFLFSTSPTSHLSLSLGVCWSAMGFLSALVGFFRVSFSSAQLSGGLYIIRSPSGHDSSS